MALIAIPAQRRHIMAISIIVGTSVLVSTAQSANVPPMSTVGTTPGFSLLTAGIFGLTGVALGAMGAHALKATLIERGMMVAWDTAARYHLFHAIALLGIAAIAPSLDEGGRRLLHWAARGWSAGIVLFSGSLYWLALGGPRWLGPVTPLGGVALMLGWLLVIVVAIKLRGPRTA